MPRVLETEDVEILIHITTPTNRESEARWRSLAESYLNFQPISRQKLEIRPQRCSVSENYMPNKVNTASEWLSADSGTKGATPLEVTRTQPPLLSESANEEDGRLLRQEICLTEEGTSLLRDLEIESSPCFSRVSSYRLHSSQDKLDFTSCCPDSKKTKQSNLKECSSSNLGHIHTPLISRHFNNDSSNLDIKKPKSVQPDLATTQSLLGPKRRAIMTAGEEDFQENPLSSLNLLATTDKKDISHLTIPKRLCVEPKISGNKGKFTELSSKKKSSNSKIANQSMRTGRWFKLLEIRPAPPEIGNSTLRPENLITQPLRVLAERGRLEQNYQPTESTRDVRLMERGYWSIFCSSWEKDLRVRCWNCLGTYIEKDNSAGWGVWCVRDENFEILRVYCWGIIIGHIYILLWIASEGKISKTGACWIDADGQEIIKISGNVQKA